MKWVIGLLINIQFFTSIPIRASFPMDTPYVKRAVQTFPIVGLIQGLILAALFHILSTWSPFSLLAIAFILWLFSILVTGGIHLDGWMDASDAYFSYYNVEKRLEIMKDPRTGAFGVLSVILLLSTRFFFLYEVVIWQSSGTYLLLAWVPFLGKTLMGLLLLHVKAAKEEGLAIMFQRAATPKSLWVYLVYVVAAVGVVSLINATTIVPVLMILSVAGFLFFFLKNIALRWFGGITGDVLGASVEGGEAVLWLAVWLLHYFVMG
jgi:adenosylcobinamide-GDP ribazoletransferase